MKIDIRIVSMHGASAQGAGMRDVPEGYSVADMLTELDLPPEDTYAVLVNDLPVAIDDREDRILVDGDKFTVFPPIRGGKPGTSR